MWVLEFIPLSFHKCSFQALMALLMCVCRCQFCWSILAGIHGCTGLMNMATGGWIAGAEKLPFFLSAFSFLKLFKWLQNYSIVLQIQLFHYFFFGNIISVTIIIAALICHGFYLTIQQQQKSFIRGIFNNVLLILNACKFEFFAKFWLVNSMNASYVSVATFKRCCQST